MTTVESALSRLATGRGVSRMRRGHLLVAGLLGVASWLSLPVAQAATSNQRADLAGSEEVPGPGRHRRQGHRHDRARRRRQHRLLRVHLRGHRPADDGPHPHRRQGCGRAAGGHARRHEGRQGLRVGQPDDGGGDPGRPGGPLRECPHQGLPQGRHPGAADERRTGPQRRSGQRRSISAGRPGTGSACGFRPPPPARRRPGGSSRRRLRRRGFRRADRRCGCRRRRRGRRPRRPG